MRLIRMKLGNSCSLAQWKVAFEHIKPVYCTGIEVHFLHTGIGCAHFAEVSELAIVVILKWMLPKFLLNLSSLSSLPWLTLCAFSRHRACLKTSSPAQQSCLCVLLGRNNHPQGKIDGALFSCVPSKALFQSLDGTASQPVVPWECSASIVWRLMIS